MRKHQQRQILELLETIEIAQSENLFADCQDGAIAVGEFIEQIKGEGTETVALLEEYCDLVYKAHTGEISAKPLKKQLIKIKNSVHYELKPDRTEMVFLSYKASMGDSVESIYLAAKEDPDCDAYWIPIPYCSRNPDGTVKETHFEGTECYPDYIECIDWQKYNIEERHPDVIFTFSAYDGYNYVSSVHPEFYCERLKNLTDCLVYIPYFVSGGSSLPEHFATLQGCIHADLVVLESEAVREQYIEHYSKAFGNKMGDPKKKFVALGSPKYDKVLTTTRENTALPEEWRKLVKDKKVILYNTSIGAILQGGEQYLKKLRHVLEAFESCDDVALWWRPHPLSESTYESMRPQLAAEYKALVAQYKKDGWGIYDDTPDMHRSIAWSDAYYGDASSVVPLFRATGKPVMMQDIDCCSNKKTPHVAWVFISKDVSLAYVYGMGAIFSIINNELEILVDCVPNEDANVSQSRGLYLPPVVLNDNLYFAPFTANEIAIYSIKTGIFNKIAIGIADVNKPLFSSAITHGSSVFFSPYAYHGILELDIDSLNVTHHVNWFDSIRDILPSLDDVIFIASSFVYDDKIWLLPRNTNILIAFDVLTHNCNIFKVGIDNYSYMGIQYDGQDYWLSPFSDSTPLIKWNPQKGVIKSFGKELFPNKVNPYSFHPAIYSSGYIWLVPNGSEYVVKINTLSDEIIIVENFEVDREEAIKGKNKFYSVSSIDNCIYAFNKKTSELSIYNCATDEFKKDILCYSKNAINTLPSIINNSFQSSVESAYVESANFAYADCFYENHTTMLNDYINFVSECEKTSEQSDVEGDVGSTIYQHIRSMYN